MSIVRFLRRARALPLLLFAASAAGAPDLALDVSLDPASRQFTGEAVLQAPPRTFSFLLHESLRVTAARSGTRAASVETGRAAGTYRQWHVRVAQPGAELLIRYEGRLPALERDRDHRGVLGHLPPMSAREGSFLSAGSHWYPRPATVLFSYRVKVAVPHGQRALVAGRRISESLPAGPGESYQASFEFTQPSPGIDLMAGPWLVREKLVPRPSGPPLFLRTFFPAELDALPGLAQAYLDDSAAYIERYSRDIGPYPYTEFSIVASPLPTGFGMPTLTYLGAEVLRLPFIRKTSLGHEILHNWWGNGVYVDYERGNWSEGLTTFMADYAYKEDEGSAAASDMRLAWLRDAALFADGKPGSLRDFRSRADAAGATLGYGKSAMLFVMLRDRLGKRPFDQGIRNFWATRRFRNAGWDDLQAAFESASGEKLGSFFAAWLDQKTLPEIAIARAESVPSGKQHLLQIGFSKKDARLPLRLPLEISAGNRRETHWIALEAGQDTASIRLAFAPQTLRLDPEMRVWRRLEASQLPPILRQWMAAGKPLLLNVGDSPAARLAVGQLAERFFEATPAPLAPEQFGAALKSGQPVLLAGTPAGIDQTLALAGLPPRPPSLAGPGTAQVWTVPGQPFALAVISGQDAAALTALQRGLPHYGGQSWLIFEQGRAIGKGIWPASVPEITVSPRPPAPPARPGAGGPPSPAPAARRAQSSPLRASAMAFACSTSLGKCAVTYSPACLSSSVAPPSA